MRVPASRAGILTGDRNPAVSLIGEGEPSPCPALLMHGWLKKQLIDLCKEESGVQKARMEKETAWSLVPGRQDTSAWQDTRSEDSVKASQNCLSKHGFVSQNWGSQRHTTDGNLQFISVYLF